MIGYFKLMLNDVWDYKVNKVYVFVIRYDICCECCINSKV